MTPFFELTLTQKAIELLRWVCVLPVAVVNFWGLVHARLHVWPGPLGVQQPFLAYDVARWLMLMLTGTAFVIAGAAMAPRRRIAAAIPLVAMFIIFFSHFAQQGQHYFAITFESLGAFGGAVWIYYSERSERRASRPPD